MEPKRGRPKLTPRQKEQLWLRKHPVARRAFVLYMTGAAKTIPEAAQQAIDEHPDSTQTHLSLCKRANEFSWGKQRQAVALRSREEIERATLDADKAAQALVDLARREQELMKPGAPRDPKAELEFLLSLRATWRENAKTETDGTKAVNWLKALREVEKDIHAISTEQAEDDSDDSVEWEAKAQEAEKYSPDTDRLVDLEDKVGKVILNPSDVILRSIADNEALQAHWRGEPVPEADDEEAP